MRIETPTIDLDPQQRILEREHRQITAERRAFERFSSRIVDLEVRPVHHVAGSSGSVGTVRRVTETTQAGLREVQQAYTETVMSVSHYDDVYAESWDEHMAEELSEELAVAIRTATQFDPRSSSRLLTRRHKL